MAAALSGSPVRKQREEPAEDRRRRLGRQLLTDDRADERGQMIVPLPVCHPARADALDRRRQNRIAPHQQAPRFFVTLGCQARGGEARGGFGRAKSRHFIDAVSVTSASSSMSPGSTRRDRLGTHRHGSRKRNRRPCAGAFLDLQYAIERASSARGHRLGACARFRNRQAQRLALGSRPPFRVEPDAADRRRAGGDTGVGNLAGPARCRQSAPRRCSSPRTRARHGVRSRCPRPRRGSGRSSAARPSECRARPSS